MTESEMLNRSEIIEALSYIYYISGLDGTIKFVSPSIQKVLGYRSDEIIGEKTSMLFERPEDRDIMYNEFIATGYIKDKELTLKKKDGGLVTLSATARLVKNESGLPVEIEGIMRDITTKKETEKKLLESEEKYRSLVDNSPIGVGISREDEIIFANKALLDMFGYDNLDEFRTLTLKSIATDEGYCIIKNRRERETRGEKLPKIFCHDIIRKDGQVRTMELISTKIHLGSSTFKQTTFQDITDRKKTEQELLDWKKRYELVSVASGEVVYDYNYSTGSILWGGSIKDVLGYDLSEMDGGFDQWAKMVDPADRERVISEINSAEKNQGYFESEYFFRHKSGNLLKISDRGFFLRGEDGINNRLIGVMQDITKRDETEDALQSKTEQMAIITDGLPALIAYVDADERFIYANREMLEWYGIEKGEIIGKKIKEIMGDEFYDKYSDNFKSVLNGKKVEFETMSFNDRSEKRFLIIKLVPHLDHDGKAKAFFSLIEDITERKKMENEIMETSLFNRSIITCASEGIIVYDKELHFMLWNRFMEELTGLAEEDVIGRNALELIPVMKEQGIDKLILRALSGETISSKETSFNVPKTGKSGWISSTYSPYKNKENEIIGVVGIIRDISERKKTEDAILRGQKLESLGLLASGIAHDFNNLLTAILGNISLAKYSSEKNSDNDQILTDAENAALRAKDLAHQLLSFSKGDNLVKRSSSIVDIIKETVSFVLRGSNIICRYHLLNDIYPVEVDKSKISQVFNNIVINSLQAMPDGGTIDIYIENVSIGDNDSVNLPSGEYIRISIHDNGIGITKENLSKIFDPYFTTKKIGNGLGLSIVYSIIKKHDGEITVSSEPGVGTAFTIFLPSADKASEPEKRADKNLSTGSGKILVLDDEEMILNVLIKMLKHLGYEVVSCSDGHDAIMLYKNELEKGSRFSAMILDLTVPGGLGGADTLKAILDMDPYAVAIASSGYSNNTIISDYEKHGFKNVIKKPYRLNDLGDILKQVIEENSR